MNGFKKYSIGILCFIIIFSLFTSNISGDTTIANSTFPAEKGQNFRWNTVNATDVWYKDIEFVQFRATNIYNDTLDSKYCMVVNYTLEFYHKYAWIPEYTNSLYLAYNYSLNFLNWSEEGYKNGNLFIFPIPINFSLIGDAIERENFFNYTVDNNKLILDDGNLTIVELTVNTTTGISEIIEKIYNGTTTYRWELNRDRVIIIVPGGNYFFIFTTFSVITLLFLEKKKIKKYFSS